MRKGAGVSPSFTVPFPSPLPFSLPSSSSLELVPLKPLAPQWGPGRSPGRKRGSAPSKSATAKLVRCPHCWNSTTRHARLDLLDTSNVSSRDVTSQVEFGLYIVRSSALFHVAYKSCALIRSILIARAWVSNLSYTQSSLQLHATASSSPNPLPLP